MPVIDPAAGAFRFHLDPAKSGHAWIVRDSPDRDDWSVSKC